MDESNATRIGTQPVEVAERSYPPQQLQISLRIETVASANHICALLLDVMEKRGHQVNSVHINRSERPLAKYQRPRGRD